jgi:hypothetical protein
VTVDKIVGACIGKELNDTFSLVNPEEIQDLEKITLENVNKRT